MSKIGTFRLGSFGRLGNQLFQAYACIGYKFRYGIDELWFNSAKVLEIIPIDYNLGNSLQNAVMLRDGGSSIKFTDHARHDVAEMVGYFQSYRYHDDIPERYFNPKLDPILNNKYRHQIEECEQSTFMHVRRGDYVKVSSHLLDVNYYKTALEKVSNYGGKLFVFSDDIPYCKKHFGDAPIYVSGNSPVEDLLLMSICKNGILSNSSFSWWGARFNAGVGKYLAPERWFDPNNVDSKDIVRENWTTI